MKRIAYWLLSTVAVVVLLFSYHTSTSGILGAGTGTSAVSHPFEAGTTATSTMATTPKSAASRSKRTTAATTTKARTPRTVTGSVVQTQWGPVQVRLSVSGSRITGVTVVQYPDGNGRDAQINSYALPILTRETVSAQGQNVQMVSGATVTSDGYLQSLQSALDRANL